MRKIIFSVLALSALVTMAFKMNMGLPIGSEMPKSDVKLKDVSGKDISMREIVKHHGVLVMFSCNTCPYVVKNQTRTIEICDYAQKNEIGVIVLNSNEAYRGDEDSFDAMKAYAKEQKYNWSYALDKDHMIADAFGANRTPECFLFDGSLKLVYHGAIDDNPSDASDIKRHHLREAINELAAHQAVTVTETKSVGCSIKRKK